MVKGASMGGLVLMVPVRGKKSKVLAQARLKYCSEAERKGKTKGREKGYQLRAADTRLIAPYPMVRATVASNVKPGSLDTSFVLVILDYPFDR